MNTLQKYTKEEIILAVDMWHESGLTKSEFCNREKLDPKQFKYWQARYKHFKEKDKPSKSKGFIPVEVSSTKYTEPTECLTITYPNGIQVSCPIEINDTQLKTLINL